MSARRLTAALAATAIAAGAPVVARAADPAPAAQAGSPSVAAGAAGAKMPQNPLIASVNGQDIHLNDVRAAAQTIPEEARNLPPQVLFPMLVNQLVDQKALVIQARKQGLQNDPKVQAAMRAADDNALQNALLQQEVGPDITDAKLHAAYDAKYANAKGEEEVHARHILVGTEAQAKDIIKQLKNGADFATLAKKDSTDKATAAQNGGDLGWFKKADMLPEFSNAAFSMKKGQISDVPVHTQFGWHVIQVLDTRTAPPPTFDSVKDQLKQGLVQQAVREAVNKAVAGVKVVHYNPDGTVAKPQAAPAGAAPASAAPASAAPASH